MAAIASAMAGGFFDRTLAATLNMPRVFGVGYSQAAIATIYPQPHDIPMNVVVTEDGVSSKAPMSEGDTDKAAQQQE